MECKAYFLGKTFFFHFQRLKLETSTFQILFSWKIKREILSSFRLLNKPLKMSFFIHHAKRYLP